MKVMLVNGSSHLQETTMTALEEMIKVFHSEEVETELFTVLEVMKLSNLNRVLLLQ